MATWVVAGIIFGTAGYIIYNTYIKKGSKGSCGCSDCKCEIREKRTKVKK
ncbi:FeoB-associated Cys-rich membrane protein [Vagococcus entomophilus]|uniref:FeoB-associated Cys-rich membrane protein n=1 Tax=Vagococcus entomophilus TaxID=1160095 RepID=A0A430AFM6_9ENTE|nr:FeoB-associated Cys-rich membrane protein [Vagococcus entomophilus]RSU06495.1 hypothetical protein CBF30_09600 [Vagococcus entomophilus]